MVLLYYEREREREAYFCVGQIGIMISVSSFGTNKALHTQKKSYPTEIQGHGTVQGKKNRDRIHKSQSKDRNL